MSPFVRVVVVSFASYSVPVSAGREYSSVSSSGESR